jgi:hypothetical protein
MHQNIRNSIERFLLSPAYFILFSAYPVLALYAHNVPGVPPRDVLRPLAVSILVALLLFLVLRQATHHVHTSALIVFTALFAFFYYGHVRNLLYSNGILIRPAALAMIWLAATGLAIAYIARHGPVWKTEIMGPVMNLVVIILLLFPLLRLAIYVVARAMPLDRKIADVVEVEADAASPDIYYIILDAYTRSDVLKEDYGYDNSAFIDSLQDMGFYVAECAQSNYDTTSLSLSSALNMEYLQNISDVYQPDETDLLHSFKALDSNIVRNSLTEAGYKTVVFASGFHWIEWRDADHFISPAGRGLTEFEIVVLFSSYARNLDDFGIVNLDDIHAEHYRERTRLVLGSFDALLDIPSPKFVFIHIIAPHEPYGFDENGNSVAAERVNSRAGYAAQAKFIGTAILPQLQKLVNQSKIPPVIIVQGDHGRLGDKPAPLMKILNAYYLPGHADLLYPSISPVNSFRLVFNSYFGTDFPLLEDISYYSTLERRYDFSVIPNTCP